MELVEIDFNEYKNIPNPKYKLRDIVYYINNNRIQCAPITGVLLMKEYSKELSLYYKYILLFDSDFMTNYRTYFESELFETKEELIAKL